MSDFDIFNPPFAFSMDDIEARISDIEEEMYDDDGNQQPLDDETLSEYNLLIEVRAEAGTYADTFISDYHMPEYAQSLAEDCGYIDDDNPLSSYIDWEKWTNDVKMDYSEIDINGNTYWVR